MALYQKSVKLIYILCLVLGCSANFPTHLENKSRLKRSLTTICVELKPGGAHDEPYYICKETDIPAFNKPLNTKTSDKNLENVERILTTPAPIHRQQFTQPMQFFLDERNNAAAYPSPYQPNFQQTPPYAHTRQNQQYSEQIPANFYPFPDAARFQSPAVFEPPNFIEPSTLSIPVTFDQNGHMVPTIYETHTRIPGANTQQAGGFPYTGMPIENWSQPKTIPAEYMDDPIMRIFYADRMNFESNFKDSAPKEVVAAAEPTPTCPPCATNMPATASACGKTEANYAPFVIAMPCCGQAANPDLKSYDLSAAFPYLNSLMNAPIMQNIETTTQAYKSRVAEQNEVESTMSMQKSLAAEEEEEDEPVEETTQIPTTLQISAEADTVAETTLAPDTLETQTVAAGNKTTTESQNAAQMANVATASNVSGLMQHIKSLKETAERKLPLEPFSQQRKGKRQNERDSDLALKTVAQIVNSAHTHKKKKKFIPTL